MKLAFSAAPLIAYLVVLPPVAWAHGRLAEGLTLSCCGLVLVTYLAVLWRGYQKALRRWDADRQEAGLRARLRTVAARHAAGAEPGDRRVLAGFLRRAGHITPGFERAEGR